MLQWRNVECSDSVCECGARLLHTAPIRFSRFPNQVPIRGGGVFVRLASGCAAGVFWMTGRGEGPFIPRAEFHSSLFHIDSLEIQTSPHPPLQLHGVITNRGLKCIYKHFYVYINICTLYLNIFTRGWILRTYSQKVLIILCAIWVILWNVLLNLIL